MQGVDLLSEEKVLLPGSKGRAFISDATNDDASKISFLDSIMYMCGIMSGVNILYIVLGSLGLLLGGDLKDELSVIYVTLLIVHVFLGGVLFLMYIVKKKDKKEYIASFVKVFDDRIVIYNYCGFWNRINMIKIDDIRVVHQDVETFLKKKCKKIRKNYSPFIRMAPSPTKFDGCLYTVNVPMRNLVRLELNKPVEVLNWDNNSYYIFKGDMITRDKVHKVTDVVISIRPDEIDDFSKLMDGSI